MEIGYHVLPAHQRRGYATEAAVACRELARERFAVDRLIAVINPANEPSRTVAERIGLRCEKHAQMYGEDRLIYASDRDSCAEFSRIASGIVAATSDAHSRYARGSPSPAAATAPTP